MDEKKIFCTNCGKEAVANSKFCIHCGKPLVIINPKDIKEEEEIEIPGFDPKDFMDDFIIIEEATLVEETPVIEDKIDEVELSQEEISLEEPKVINSLPTIEPDISDVELGELNNDIVELDNSTINDTKSTESIDKLKTINNSFVIELVKRVLFLVLGLFLFISTFCKIGSYTITFDKDYSSFHVTSYQSVRYFFDSFKNLDEEEMKDDEVNKKYNMYMDSIEDINYFSMTNIDIIEDVMQKIEYYGMRTFLRSDTTKMTPSIVIFGIISIIYILFSISFFVIAIINFAYLFTKEKCNRQKNLQKTSLIMTIIAPFSIVITAYVIKNAMIFPNNNVLNFQMSDFSIFLVVLSTLVIIANIFIKCVIEEKQLKLNLLLKNFSTIILAILLMFTLLAPIASSKVDFYFNRNSGYQDNGGFYNKACEYEGKFYLETQHFLLYNEMYEFPNEIKINYMNFSARQALLSETYNSFCYAPFLDSYTPTTAQTVNNSVLVNLNYISNMDSYSFVFSLIPIIYTVIMILLSVFIIFKLFNIFNDNNKSFVELPVIVLILTLLSYVLVSIFVKNTNENLILYGMNLENYSVSIGFGAYLTIFSSFVLCAGNILSNRLLKKDKYINFNIN